MTLFDYISFMEDKNNIDTYVFVKKEKTVISQEETIESTILDDGTVEYTKKINPVETVTAETYKYTLLENGAIKKELYTQEMMDALISTKQTEIDALQKDKEIVQSL